MHTHTYLTIKPSPSFVIPAKGRGSWGLRRAMQEGRRAKLEGLWEGNAATRSRPCFHARHLSRAKNKARSSPNALGLSPRHVGSKIVADPLLVLRSSLSPTTTRVSPVYPSVKSVRPPACLFTHISISPHRLPTSNCRDKSRELTSASLLASQHGSSHGCLENNSRHLCTQPRPDPCTVHHYARDHSRHAYRRKHAHRVFFACHAPYQLCSRPCKPSANIRQDVDGCFVKDL